PVSNVPGIGTVARHDVPIKGSEVINDFSKVETIVFDKTSTLTFGKTEVAENMFYGKNIDEMLGCFAREEPESDHPLAKAVLEDIGEIGFSVVEATEVVKGKGVIAKVDGYRLAVGNAALMERENVVIHEHVRKDMNQFEKNGNPLVLTAVN